MAEEELPTLDTLTLSEPAYRIAESSDVGRHIVATRSLAQGEVVITDIPLVTGPARDSEPVCLGCYRLIDLTRKGGEEKDGVKPHFSCPRCMWPMCGEACANSPRHKPECFFLFQSGCRVNAADTDSLYDVIMVLRCLYLRETDQNAWLTLLGLQTADPSSMDEELAERASKVANLICGTFKLGDRFSREVVFEMCGRLETNAFEIPLGISSASIQGVYAVACLVEHSCIPSGHRTFNADMSLTVRAAYSLDEGDSITLCYTDSLWTTAQRREHLVYSKDFICNCVRCQDKTENGTFMSGLKCLKCPDGYYLADSPLDCTSKWTCTVCNLQAPQGYSDMAEKKVSEAVSKLEADGLSVASCQKFINLYGRVLHPNHAHMLDVKYSLLNLLGHSEDSAMASLTEAELNLKESLGKTFLDVASKILPGISRLKGTALYELFLTLKQRAILALSELGKVDHSQESVLGLLETAGQHLQECLDCLQFEPAHRPEGQLYLRAKDDRLEVLQLIQHTKTKFASLAQS